MRRLVGQPAKPVSATRLDGTRVRFKTMFAVHDRAGANQSRGDAGFNSRPISRMDDIGAALLNGTRQHRQLKARVRILLALTNNVYPILRQALRIRPEAAYRINDMFESSGIETVNQVYEPVLQTSFPEVIHHVHDTNRHVCKVFDQ